MHGNIFFGEIPDDSPDEQWKAADSLKLSQKILFLGYYKIW